MPLSLLGKYTCSGIVPAQLNICVYICINFLWNVWNDLSLLTCSFPFLLQAVSSFSVWEWEWFATAIWEINKCFHRLFSLSTGTGWGGMRSLNHADNITSMMTRFILWNSLNKLLCPLVLLSSYEYSYEHRFWYLGWVFLHCKLPRNILY